MVNMPIKRMYAQLAIVIVQNVVVILNAVNVSITISYKMVIVWLLVKLVSMVMMTNQFV